jgi:disulfide bond formation protein DsbB
VARSAVVRGRGPFALGPAEAARFIALLLPLGLLGGALASQYIGGLHPCEMCYWQRWPHGAAIVLAALSFTAPASSARSRAIALAAAAAIAISGVIGVFHAGVELGWWEGFTSCTATGAVSLDSILAAPLVRCDQVQWAFLGLSMAAWNAVISLGSAAIILLLSRRATAR